MLRAVLRAGAACRASRTVVSMAQRAAAARPGLAAAAPAGARPFAGSAATRFRSANVAAAAEYGNTDVQGASELIQSGASTYADVRTPEEFAAGHPPGAVNVPVFLKQNGQMVPNPQFQQQFEKAFPDKDAQLCVGCLSGKRSIAACNILQAAGYSNLTNVEGGFQAWTGAGLPVEA